MKKLVSILLIALVVLASGCGGGAAGESLDELLSLGQKYLLDGNYEEAIVAFEKAIQIDKKCVDAYLGMADAYIGLEDIASAKEILQKGYDETGDERLKEKLAKLNGSFSNSFTDEQNALLERLDRAAEAFDYAQVYEIMTSAEFLGLYANLQIDPVSRSGGVGHKSDGSWSWELGYWDAGGENNDEKDYFWSRTDPDKMSIGCQLWLQTGMPPAVAIRHMSLVDREENGKFEIIHYIPNEILTRYEGTALNRLHHGTETVTDMLTGERTVYQYDDAGMLTNYQVDENGQAYVVSENGGRRHAMIDHAVQASTIH